MTHVHWRRSIGLLQKNATGKIGTPKGWVVDSSLQVAAMLFSSYAKLKLWDKKTNKSIASMRRTVYLPKHWDIDPIKNKYSIYINV